MAEPRYGGAFKTSARRTIALGVGGRGEITQVARQFEQIQALFRSISRRAGTLDPLWDEVFKIVEGDIQHRFDTEAKEETSSSRKWKGLAKSTKRLRKSRGTWPGLILTETGKMRESIQITRQTNKSIKITATDPKAPVHHFGLGGMPRRPFMYMNPDTLRKIHTLLNDHLEGIINERAMMKKRYSEVFKRPRIALAR
jgi:phage gpG-like protein